MIVEALGDTLEECTTIESSKLRNCFQEFASNSTEQPEEFGNSHQCFSCSYSSGAHPLSHSLAPVDTTHTYMGIASSSSSSPDDAAAVAVHVAPPCVDRQDDDFVMVDRQEPCGLESSMLEAARRGQSVPSEMVSDHVAQKRRERSQRSQCTAAQKHCAAAGGAPDFDYYEGAAAAATDDGSKARGKQRRFFAEKERLQDVRNAIGRAADTSEGMRNSPPNAVGVLQDLSMAEEESMVGSMRDQRRLRAWRARDEKALATKAKEVRALQFQQMKKASRKTRSIPRSAYHRTTPMRKPSSMAFVGNLEASAIQAC